MEISGAVADDEVIIYADVKNIPDGEMVNISIWEYNDNNKHDFVKSFESKIKKRQNRITFNC